MNKRLIVLIALVIIIGLAVFVSAEWSENSPVEGKLSLVKGWNLVSYYALDDKYFYEEIDVLKMNGINAVFMYNPINQRYIRLYPDYELTKAQEFFLQLEEGNQEYTPGNMAMWVYSDKAQDIQFTTKSTIYSVSSMTLRQGWNFLAITSEFKEDDDDFQLEEFKGNCDIQKIYYFGYDQKWYEVQLDTDFSFKDSLWKGIIIKVPNDCNLGTPVGETPSVPQLP